MQRVLLSIGVCLILLTAAVPTFAQQRLFARMESEIVELDLRLASLGAVLHRLPLEAIDPDDTRIVTFGGGTQLAWAARGAVLLLDTRSGTVQRFTFPGFGADQIVGTDGAARLVVSGGAGLAASVLVADARSGRVHFVDLGPASMLGPITYASASDRLFVAKRRPTTPPSSQTFHDVDVIQAATGVLINTLDISPAYVLESAFGVKLSVDTAGTRLFVNVAGRGTFAFDVATGTLAASNTTLELGQLDERRNRFVTGGTGVIAAFAADSLTFLGSAPVPQLPPPPPAQTSGTTRSSDLDVSGVSATIFVLESLATRFADRAVCESQVHALHTDTGRLLRTVRTTNTLGNGACTANLIRTTEPAPPSALTAAVVGGRVTLTWQASFGATQYELGAGVGPGRTTVATIRVNDPHLVVEGVPAGTYYVRVRSLNSLGTSGASQEVQVVVP